MDGRTPGTTNNPLFSTLDADQACLLRVIAWPLTAGLATDVQHWPVWDGVVRRFNAERPGTDTEAVLASLPRLLPTQFHPLGYGLCWREGRDPQPLQPGERIGLTIAGLLSLAMHDSEPALAAERITSLIRQAVQLEADLPTEQIWAVEEGAFDIRPHLLTGAGGGEQLRLTEGETQCVLTTTVAGLILLHEFEPLCLNTTQHNYEIKLGGGRLRRYREMVDAASYVHLISQLADQAHPEPAHTAPLPLPETLDLLGYVLHADPAWTVPGAALLTASADLSSAAALSRPVQTQADFLDRLGSLWTILGKLHVPAAAAEELSGRGWTRGTINDLEIWLQRRFEANLFANRIRPQIAVIRAVQKIRTYGVHPGKDNQRDAARARERLGLPNPITDWASAWQSITDRLAGAFDLIRLELQAEPPPA